MKRLTHKPSSKEGRRENRVRGTPENQIGTNGQQNIRDWMNRVRFRKVIVGGVRESDVWKKIAELNTIYEAALSAERVRYDTLLQERVSALARQMYQRGAEQEKSGDGQHD